MFASICDIDVIFAQYGDLQNFQKYCGFIYKYLLQDVRTTLILGYM